MHYYGDTQQEFTESALPGQPEDEEHLKFLGTVTRYKAAFDVLSVCASDSPLPSCASD